MQKFILFILTFLFLKHSFGQSADELNKKANDLLILQDYKNAVPLLKQAADKENAEAQYNLGICYQQGVAVTQSDSLANIWFMRSAIQGSKNAQFKVAYSYAIGRGWQKNEKAAFYWSLKCAQQEDPECIFNVVNCYLEGIGTIKNIDSMLVWTTRLALLENPEDLKLSGQITSARINLATMYQDGKNVQKDLLKSYMWYLIYNESKRDFSYFVQKENIENIQLIEKLLTQAEQNNAKIEAESLIAKKLINLGNLYKPEL